MALSVASLPRTRWFGRRTGLGVLLAALLVALAPGSARAIDAAYVINAGTGEVLHAANARARLYPASLVKMMTLYMTFEALRDGRLHMREQLYVSRRAAGMTPTKLYLQAGRTISVRDAVMAVAVKSANDAAVVLAEALARSEFQFAVEMTERARELGMTDTQFRNASGLPNRHQVSSARDMAHLGNALLTDFPQYYGVFARETFRYKGHDHENHNNLLNIYQGTDGIKTGYTADAGFNIVTAVERHGHRLIGVVMGGDSAEARDRRMMTLLDRAFAELRQREPVQVVGPPPRKPERVVRLAARESGATPGAQGSAPGDAATETAGAERGGGDWAIQVGAYSDAQPARLAARAAADQVPQLLNGANVAVTRPETRQVYRARLRDLPRRDAVQACRLLKAVNRGCLVIEPGGAVEVAFDGG